MEENKLYEEDCIDALKGIDAETVHCCVTSPPYYGLRDYGDQRQIGLESTPEEYIEKLVSVFREVKRVLMDDGTLWINISDSYSGSGKGGAGYTNNALQYKQGTNTGSLGKGTLVKQSTGCKPKDLIGIPWMLAFALRADGWYWRDTIIWHKPSCMPESVKDRTTRSHEYILLFSKNKNYYYNADAIKTEAKNPIDDIRRINGVNNGHKSVPDTLKNGLRGRKPRTGVDSRGVNQGNGDILNTMTVNKRSVWTVSIQPLREAHFATFPERLIIDCIKAGCPIGGVVLDPFFGSGTTGIVARKLGCYYIGCEINSKYIKIFKNRILQELGMFA